MAEARKEELKKHDRIYIYIYITVSYVYIRKNIVIRKCFYIKTGRMKYSTHCSLDSPFLRPSRLRPKKQSRLQSNAAHSDSAAGFGNRALALLCVGRHHMYSVLASLSLFDLALCCLDAMMQQCFMKDFSMTSLICRSLHLSRGAPRTHENDQNDDDDNGLGSRKASSA